MITIKKHLQKLKPYIPGEDITGNIKLASNENPLGPSPKAIDAILRTANDISRYPSSDGPKLKKEIAKKLLLSDKNIILGNGSDEILLLIATTFITTEDEIITVDPTFSIYETTTQLFDGKTKKISLEDGYYNFEKIKEAINPNTKIIYLCNPNNPTGTIFEKKQLESLLKTLPSNILIVIDEAYNEYVTNPEYPKVLDYIKDHNIIVLRTFSKIYGLAGLRIGYGIANTNLIEKISKVQLPFSVNKIAQKAALAALRDNEFLKKSLNNNEQGKQFLYQELGKIGLKYIKTEANFIYIETPISANKLFKMLSDKGITIRALDSFGCKNAIRVSIGLPEENKAFIENLKAVLPKSLIP